MLHCKGMLCAVSCMDFLDVLHWHAAVNLAQKLLQRPLTVTLQQLVGWTDSAGQAIAFGKHCLHIFAVCLNHGANLARHCVSELKALLFLPCIIRNGAEGGSAIAL